MLAQPKRLSNHPSHPVALHGVARRLCRDSEAQPRAAAVVRARDHREEAVAEASSARVGGLEVGFPAQAPLWRKPQALEAGASCWHAIPA